MPPTRWVEVQNSVLYAETAELMRILQDVVGGILLGLFRFWNIHFSHFSAFVSVKCVASKYKILFFVIKLVQYACGFVVFDVLVWHYTRKCHAVFSTILNIVVNTSCDTYFYHKKRNQENVWFSFSVSFQFFGRRKNMIFVIYIFIEVISLVAGHGMIHDPPGRGTLWLYSDTNRHEL